jgi:hypothetical protein
VRRRTVDEPSGVVDLAGGDEVVVLLGGVAGVTP